MWIEFEITKMIKKFSSCETTNYISTCFISSVYLGMLWKTKLFTSWKFFKGWTLSLSLWYCLDIFFHLISIEQHFLTTLRYPYQMFSCLLCTVFEAIANWLLSKRIKVNNVADLTIQTRFYLTFQAKPELFPLPIDQS